MADPPMGVDRLASAPMPSGTCAVSPVGHLTASGDRPKRIGHDLRHRRFAPLPLRR
jgi:hypothetical protein